MDIEGIQSGGNTEGKVHKPVSNELNGTGRFKTNQCES